VVDTAQQLRAIVDALQALRASQSDCGTLATVIRLLQPLEKAGQVMNYTGMVPVRALERPETRRGAITKTATRNCGACAVDQLGTTAIPRRLCKRQKEFAALTSPKIATTRGSAQERRIAAIGRSRARASRREES